MSVQHPVNIQYVVSGRVQGVGYRPFVRALAQKLGISGTVENRVGVVYIDALGDEQSLNRFEQALRQHAPREAIVRSITKLNAKDTSLAQASRTTDTAKLFRIIEARSPSCAPDQLAPEPAPDRAICSQCITELFDPDNRRFLHPHISCTLCGPRHSIALRHPYERRNTSMGHFSTCGTCDSEYISPDSRREHAQTISCHQCGPRYRAYSTDGFQESGDAFALAADHLSRGNVVAMKGLGGFHLFVDASNERAITQLRKRKNRPKKPLALMFANVQSIAQRALVPVSTKVLESPESPILVTRARPPLMATQPLLAPGFEELGVMRPYTGAHLLLFYHLLGKPSEPHWLNTPTDLSLICTSANLSHEPMISRYEGHQQTLHALADLVLDHDRDIINPCDDSVVRVDSKTGLITSIRLSRGYTPLIIDLPDAPEPLQLGTTLGLGAHLKTQIALSSGRHIIYAPFIGDTDSLDKIQHYQNSVHDFINQSDHPPQSFAHDSHPDFASTHLASELARQHGAHLAVIQHHRAHVAAVMAEHRITQTCIAVAFDGYGYGDQAQAWGGEMFFSAFSPGEGLTLKHLSQVEQLKLTFHPDRGAVHIDELALSFLRDRNENTFTSLYQNLLHTMEPTRRRELELSFQLTRPEHERKISSVGRWFDIAACLMGLSTKNEYEGYAASLLEQRALNASEAQRTDRDQPFILEPCKYFMLSPLIEALCRKHQENLFSIEYLAYLFHKQLAQGLCNWIAYHAKLRDTKVVILAGGCFQNILLTHLTRTYLEENDFTVYSPSLVPANDAAIALGQVWLSLYQAKETGEESQCV